MHQLKLWNEDNDSNILVPWTQAYAMNKTWNDQVEIDDKVHLKSQATWSNKCWRSLIWNATFNTSNVWLELVQWWRIVHDLFQWTMWKVKSKYVLHKEPEHRRRIGEAHVYAPSNKSHILLRIKYVEDLKWLLQVPSKSTKWQKSYGKIDWPLKLKEEEMTQKCIKIVNN